MYTRRVAGYCDGFLVTPTPFGIMNIKKNLLSLKIFPFTYIRFIII